MDGGLEASNSPGLPLGVALRRLIDEMNRNSIRNLLANDEGKCFDSLEKISKCPAANVAAHLFLRKSRLFFVPSLFVKYAEFDSQLLEQLQHHHIATEIRMAALAEADIIHQCVDVLTRAEIESLMDTPKMRAKGVAFKRSSRLKDMRCCLIEILTKSQPDELLETDAAFLRIELDVKSLYHKLCDILCILCGGKWSQNVSPPRIEEAHDGHQYYRAFRVSEILATFRTPADHFETNAFTGIAPLLWKSTAGVELAVDAFRQSWEIHIVSHAPRKGMISAEWVRAKSALLNDIILAGVDFPPSEEVRLYMGEKCTILYIARSALAALANCAKRVQDLPLAQSLYLKCTQSPQGVSLKIASVCHQLALCYAQRNSPMAALRLMEDTLSQSISYTAPFSSTNDFFRFSDAIDGKTLMRLADRLAIERTLQTLHKPPFRWNAFRGTKLNMLRRRVIQGVRCGNRKRWSRREGSCSVEDFALEYYLSALGPSWTGVHCEGSLISSLFFVLLADMRVPDGGGDDIWRYFYPCRFREVPVDFGSPKFVSHRKHSLSELFHSLGSMAAQAVDAHIRSKYDTFKDSQYGELYSSFPVDTLSTVARALFERKALIPLMHFMLLECSTSGLPDLWLWTAGVEASSAPSLRCVEVKAPNDSLSDKQRAWIHVLSSIGVCVEVCSVTEANPKESVDRCG
ncbi:fanconi-associated nuclease [Perkinsela sp. CCAP 1560/4]|nr:fanconi-associated nuclease [Perkinsela sp. CCAP 1560/4]|eukprot:KNH05438.1 fanconi-associated nuclease [Perkinsela sp. CCAP 1560/4]